MKKLIFFSCFLFLCSFTPVFAHDKMCHESSSATNPSCQPNFTKSISTKGLSKTEKAKVIGYETGKEHGSQHLPRILSVDSDQTYRTLYNEYYNKGYREGSQQTANITEQKEASYYVKKGYKDGKNKTRSSSSLIPEPYLRFYEEGYKRGQEEKTTQIIPSTKKATLSSTHHVYFLVSAGGIVLFVFLIFKRKRK